MMKCDEGMTVLSNMFCNNRVMYDEGKYPSYYHFITYHTPSLAVEGGL